ncbi:MAG: SRPBCC family protein [Thermoplasmata archaeon]|nr:SRPBCC family protein [Thermoplasmata archaeon]
MGSWPPPNYEIRPIFGAPLPYVYRWLTDYSSQDPALEKGKYQRRVIERSRKRAVLEDLTETKKGWEWYRSVVTLHPPNRWHAELRGNVPDWSLDYRLTPLEPDRTLLTIRWHIRQRPRVRGQPNPSKAATERMMRRLWKNFARALERDYRQTLRGRAPSRAR